MSASRVPYISANIEFAFDENRALAVLISEAQKTDGQVKHISQKAGSILGAVRECFDYFIADIKSDFLPDARSNVYFPFHPDTLSRGKPLYPLSEGHGHVYAVLQSVANKIVSGDTIPGTICSYGDMKAVNELVNSKKHDRVTEVVGKREAKSRIEFPGGAVVTVSPMYKVNDNGSVDFSQPHSPVGAEGWTNVAGGNVIAVKDFLFNVPEITMSRNDVHGFCMMTITAARFILSDLYNQIYGLPSDQFKEQ